MRKYFRVAAILVCLFSCFTTSPNAQQGPPVINSINPTSVAAGSPGFTLTVTGSGFGANSIVRLNGNNRPTVLVGNSQLLATILASDIATAGPLAITVFNPVVGVPGGGFTSNAAILAVGNPPPTLTSVAPGQVAAGSSQARITLIGTNFRPGAMVVISPPVASVAGSTANNQATDISVDSVQRINGNVLVALVSVGPTATASMRAIDVVNADQTSTGGANSTGGTGSGTTQPLRVAAGSSLGGPLSVVTIAVTHPRDGTLVTQGDELYGEAILGGTGSGTVVGQWLWDGNITEQFVSTFAGGGRVTLKTQRSLPTSFLGVHSLELRIMQPNQVLSRPIRVVVNPGDWQTQRIVGPAYGAGFAADAPPLLRWAPVPGAMKYQVGFATRPYFSAVETWHDVDDNQWEVPRQVWKALPEGELYWTVRAIESSDVARKPLPLRRILRFPSGALAASSAAPGWTAAGNPLLSWQGLSTRAYYRISVSQDAEGTHVLRRYLTADPRLDLRALRGKLVPGQTYYWKVDAIAPDGSVILEGPVASFVATPSPQARVLQGGGRLVLASLRTSRPERAVAPALPDIESLIANRLPSPESTVTEAKPAITIQFKSPVNPADLALVVDDTDVTSLVRIADTQVSYTPALALANGTHAVNLTVGNDAASWKFTVLSPEVAPAPASEAQAGGYQAGTDAEAPPAPEKGGAAKKAPAGERPKGVLGPETQTQISANSQWVSGSAPDTTAISFGQQMLFQDGPWRVEMNGSGLLNTVWNPEIMRTSTGLVNDYIFRIAYQAKHWGSNLRFGILSPALYSGAQFVTAATPRQGVEFTETTPAGAFAYFTNTNDKALGGGAGVGFHQRLMGAAWQAPLPKKFAEFRLMWLSARDTGAPTTIAFDSMGNPVMTGSSVGTASAGDAYGGLLTVHLGPLWQWTSEYGWSYENSAIKMAGSRRLFGRAWRTGVAGTIHKAALNIAYRDVGPNFSSPANPSLGLLSNPNRRGVDSSFSDPTRLGTFSLGYSFLESNINDVKVPEQLLHNFTETWSKGLNPKTVVSLNAHQTLTHTGTVPAAVLLLPPDQQKQLEPDQFDKGANLSIIRQVGKVTLTLGGVRDWFRNDSVAGQNVITSSINGGANWTGPQWFQFNGNVSVNWIAADRATVGSTRTISGYVQPTFTWKHANFQVAPLASVNNVRTELNLGLLTNDTLTGHYGGRVSWTMPGHLRFSTLTMEGDLTSNRNNVTGVSMRDVRLLLVWNVVWGRKAGFR